MPGPISYEFTNGVATITMDDGKANAMGVAMLQALNAALDQAEHDGAVVLLCGRTGMFSGGFDLAAFKRSPDEIRQMLEAGALLTQRLLSFPRPVLAVCTGHAIAMGAFILLCADTRIGVDTSARIQVNEVQIGMTLPRFALEVCRHRLARPHLQAAVLTARPHTPQQAVEAGFLDEVLPAETLAVAAREAASKLATLHAESFAASKKRLHQSTLVALRDAIHADIAEWTDRFGRAA